MPPSGVEKILSEIGVESSRYLCNWRDYKCYEPVFSEDKISFVGLPQIILVSNNGEARLATPEESMQFIDEASE